MLQRLTATLAGNVTIYRVLDQDVYLAYENRVGARPGPQRFVYDGETARLVLTALADTRRLRNFYGANHFRSDLRGWIRAERGNLAEMLDYCNFIFAVGPAPLPETGLPGLTAQIQENPNPISQAYLYIGLLQANGMLYTTPPSIEWKETLLAESACIPEARGILRHPIYPDGDAEGWLDERPSTLPEADPSCPHLHRLFSSMEMDEASRCVLYSYLFAAFHKCSLNQPRPLLFVDSIEQGVGKSVTGEAIATLVDDEPKTLSLDRNSNEGDEIVAQLAHGNRCLVIPNLAHRKNWNNTLLSTLCTDVGQSRRLKYSTKSTTFYGTLGITSAVLGAVSLHRDLISRIWRVSLSAKAQPQLAVVPQQYAAEHRAALQAEILLCHRRAKPYEGRLSTRFTQFEQAGCSAYAAFTGRSSHHVSALMHAAERARHFFRDEVMASLYRKHPEDFREKLAWTGVGEGQDWLRQHDGAHGFGYTLEDGKWTTLNTKTD